MFFSSPLLAVALVSLPNFVSAQDRTSVAQQAAISDPAEQCRYYNYPPIAGQAVNFPKVWETAEILPNDAAARAKYNEISKSVPNIAPKGNFTQTLATYNVKNDPDCWWSATECTTAKAPGVPSDITLVPEPQTLGYGFDDGPNCSHNAFYDYLTSQNQKATMFFIGSNVLGWPLQAKRAVEDGHEVCTPGHIRPMQIIKLVTGGTPTCFRPPQGDIDDRIRYIVHALGLRSILWKYDVRDTILGPNGVVDTSAVEGQYEEFIKTAQGGAFRNEGAILLAHETNNMTMSEAMKYYPQLKTAFKHLVPIGVALNVTQPYVENGFSQPTFEQYISGTTQTSGPAPSSNSSSPSGSASRNNTSTKPPTGNSTTPAGRNGAISLVSSSIGSISLPAFLLYVSAIF
ncbi:carbohydrate esterase family 4 protein [Moniliophthora roreri]|nr:carbohydrate esterase family 4 protein [Moniliophthora roreri]